jgi:polysaccharide export outer membrane protein
MPASRFSNISANYRRVFRSKPSFTRDWTPRKPANARSTVEENLFLRLGAALLLFVLLLCCAVGCQTSTPSDFSNLVPTMPGPGSADHSTNALQEGDVVSITFQYSTNFNAVQKINLDGLMNLESAGQVRAAGRTPLQLQAELTRIYKPLVKDDVITVKLVSANNGVYVSGAVFRPGRIAMERPMTLIEAIMEAGGFDPNRAKLSEVIVLRVEHGKQRSYHFNLKRALEGKDEDPFYLKPFDVVHVPTKTFNF